ncbi:MAG: phosphoribosylanthranilate isomerase [Candidatus Marinimicrobia bacterium]|nr:phosphoribosylanthranilate isomerase [Candidatus Neomarinimicrobiota bacterium]
MINRFWTNTVKIPKLKICGVNSVDFAIDCYDLGVDALGFHIWEHEFLSGEWQQKISLFSEITSILPSDISLTLVTNIKDTRSLKILIKSCRFDSVQLHRRIAPVYFKHLIEDIKIIKEGLKIIGVIAVNLNEATIKELYELMDEYGKICDAILLDSSWKGGSGKTHDWALSAKLKESINSPCILAGGLNIRNIIKAIQLVKPFAVDIQSGIEKKLQKGTFQLKAKSILKVEEIISAIRTNFWQKHG